MEALVVKTNPRTFWRRVETGGACWEWRGHRNKDGYGIYSGRTAHRVAYELTHGPIPGDQHVDHLCRNHGCVFPGHLRARDAIENISDNGWRGRVRCLYGHPWTPENTAYRRRHGRRSRVCRACNRERAAGRRKP